MDISWFALFWIAFALTVVELVAFLFLYRCFEERFKAAEDYRIALNRELAKGDDNRMEIEMLQKKLAAEKDHKRDVASRLLDATTKLEIIRDTLGPQVDGPSEDQIAAVESAARWLKAGRAKEETACICGESDCRVEKLPPDARN